MGLGLSALTALVLLLPGIAFVLGLTRLWSPTSRSSPFEQHFSAGLLIAIAAALLLHAFGIAFAEIPHALGLTGAPAPSLAVLLLAGDLEAAGAGTALRTIEHDSHLIALYFGFVSVVGLAAGRFSNRWLPKPARAEWAALLEPPAQWTRDSGFAVLTADVAHDDATWLYSGYLDDFIVDREGRLDRVVFRGYAARRRVIDEDAAEPVDDDTFVPAQRWIEIPGEIFVLQMAQSRTINIDYFFDEPDDGATPGESAASGTASPQGSASTAAEPMRRA